MQYARERARALNVKNDWFDGVLPPPGFAQPIIELTEECDSENHPDVLESHRLRSVLGFGADE